MKIANLYIALFSLLTIVLSCTKVIDIKTGNASGNLGIEANVVDTPGVQIIRLSKSVPFGNTNNYPPVIGATVMVTDHAGTIYSFSEASAGTYNNNRLSGMRGVYKMTVVTGNTTYTATSTLPVKVALDSVTSQNDPISNGGKQKKEIVVHFQDPAGVSNYYRIIMFVNGVQVKAVFAFDDVFNDGHYVSNILRQNDTDIYAGDKVTIEMQCIDQPVYLYWFTLLQQGNNGPGGSVAPSDPPSNISPASLGYFSAHTSQTKSIVVK